MNDPLEAFLARKPDPSANEGLRAKLLLQTTRLLRRRRHWRRLGFLAALAACYVAGLVTMRLLPAAPQVDQPITVQPPPPSDNKKPPVPPVVVEAMKNPVQLEWQAVQNEEKRAQLYRLAAQQYAQDSDWQSALRCYGNSLNVASEQDLTISVNDDWLLMAIKDARQKEKTHVKIGG
jgi:hypothetical protein